MLNAITIAELPAILAQFINARRGWEAHREVEVNTPGIRRINANVRAVDAENVELVYDGFHDLIPLASITNVVVRNVDADGSWGAETVYNVTPAMQVAA